MGVVSDRPISRIQLQEEGHLPVPCSQRLCAKASFVAASWSWEYFRSLIRLGTQDSLPRHTRRNAHGDAHRRNCAAHDCTRPYYGTGTYVCTWQYDNPRA
jgi:hypothetical protein